jgi:type II secretory pathway pseudopilin PulG
VADIGPALVTGGAAIVGVVAGAGLTYWLGAMNRRHQEEREDKTRWYEARLQAYIKLNHALDDMTTLLFHPEKPPPKARWEATATTTRTTRNQEQ